MKFFYQFLSDDADLTAATENPEFPVENLQDQRRKRIYRDEVGYTAGYIVADFGAPVTFQALILLDHTLSQADFNAGAWRFQANATNSWGSPTVDEVFPAYQEGRAILVLDEEVTFRYARFPFTKADADTYRDFGRLFIGPLLDVGVTGDPNWGGFSKQKVDPSEIQETIGREKLTYVKEKNLRWKMDFGGIPDSVVDEIEYMVDRVGVSKPHFFRVQDTGKLSRVEYARLSDTPEFQEKALDSEFHWDYKLNYDEEL